MIRVQQSDFSIADELGKIRTGRDDAGAIVSFTGQVRNHPENDRITAMILEHYPGMTEKELERIEAEARSRWQLLDCLIIHRYGRLLPGDQIVLVITLSAHRRDAFEAASFLMDYLKTSAPFWKKEETEEGANWVEAKDSDMQARTSWDKS